MTETEIQNVLRESRPLAKRRKAARAALVLAGSARRTAQFKLQRKAASVVQESWPPDRDQLEHVLWPALSEYAEIVFDEIAKVRIETLSPRFSLRRFSDWLRCTVISAVVDEDICPPGGQFYTTMEHVLGVLGDSRWPTVIRETKRALYLMTTEFLGGHYSDNLEKRLRAHLDGRIPQWEAKAIEKTSRPPEQPKAEVGNGKSSSTTKPAARRGYRPEVRQWMATKGLRTVPQAADRLGVGYDILKSIMSDKGKKRYGNDTLIDVLQKIRGQVK